MFNYSQAQHLLFLNLNCDYLKNRTTLGYTHSHTITLKCHCALPTLSHINKNIEYQMP
jgi:hypothetical protein